jgi:ATP-dependent helicase/nuclease subunit A
VQKDTKQSLLTENKTRVTMNKLLVYQASAGSGKTFKLTENYLRLLFSKPDAYKHTLAVTFTNKATEEMKTRILLELHLLADNQQSDYIPIFCDASNPVAVKALRKQAKEILQTILHDYSRFKVSTIDRFFQQIIRSFIREIGLNGNYMLELDNKKVLAETVETMMLQLDDKKHKKLLEWLISLAEQRIESGQNWTFKNDIIALGEEIFKEHYLRFSDELEKVTEKEVLHGYIQSLKEIKKTVQDSLQQKAQQIIALVTSNGLTTTDFKAHTLSIIDAFAVGTIRDLTATFLKLETDTSSFCTKTSKDKDRINSLVNNGLHHLVVDFIHHYQSHIVHHNTADVIIKYSNILGIITDIHTSIKENNNENNALLLSDSSNLLHAIINDSDTPFIYEKIGTYLNHYLLDEFQDTSVLQWENFKPLIANSLANGNSNLIVGDVKQSIYRWRSSDWRILAQRLDKEFPNYIQHESLQDNWRSDENVISFNNDLFSFITQNIENDYNNSLSNEHVDTTTNELSHVLSDSYAQVLQNFPAKKAHRKGKGYIEIQLTEGKNKEEFETYSLQKLVQHIEKIQDAGYLLRDIAILTRTRAEGRKVAEFLLQYKNNPLAQENYSYDIISEESLCISNSKVVQFMIAILLYQIEPSDKVNALKVVYLYNQLLHPTQSLVSSYLSMPINKETSVYDVFSEQEKSTIVSCAHLPLYEMTEKLIELFTLNQFSEDIVYIQAFQDVTLDFIAQKGSDLRSFLAWWDETGKDKTVSTSDNQNAIRIITIHKSKGLDFGFVLLPFATWSLDHSSQNSTIMWCKPTEAPFNQLPIVPVSYGSALAKTLFQKDYFEEKMYAHIDSINTLYVALTRAKYGIFATALYGKKPEENKTISDLLYNYCTHTSSENDTIDENCFAFGKWETMIFETKKHTDKQAKQVAVYFSSDPSSKISLHLHASDFIGLSPARDYGQLMHRILEHITCKEDVASILLALRMEGKINEQETNEIQQQLALFFLLPEAQEWFSGNYQSYNERSILTANAKKYRPDKILTSGKQAIVIDYKFGEEKTTSHEKQLKTYMQLLKEMNFTEIDGFIYYGKTNTIHSYSLQ